MNKKKIFSPTLYIEGLRQLKIMGVISFVIYILEAVLIPLNQSWNVTNAEHIITGINDMHPVIYLTYTVIAPLFTLYLFRFLTERNSSDFYHSIPQTRNCLFISYIAAIITWLAIIHFVSSGISILIHVCIPNTYTVNFARTLPPIIGVFIAAVGVVCGVALAQCITGTLLTNIIVSGIILFFPRLLTFAITENILSKIHEIVPGEHLLPMLNGKYNLISGIFLSLSDIPDNFSIFSSYSSWIYTLILAVIYFTVGLYLFNKRKSESAANAAPNRFLQAVYRICFTLSLCLIPITIICQDMDNEIVAYFTMYVIIAVFYFLFEIITTKTVRNLLKTIPGLIIIAILNVGIIFFIDKVSDYELNLCPAPSEVSYVNVMVSTDNANYIWDSNQRSYYYGDVLSEKIKIDDSELIEDIIESLKADIKHYNNVPDSSSYEVQSFRTFAIHMKDGKTYYRHINVNRTFSANSALFVRLNEYLSHDSKYIELIDNLPKAKDTSIDIARINATSSEKKAIYNAFLKDYAKLSSEEKAAFLTDTYSESTDSEYNLSYMTVSFYSNNKRCHFEVPINTEFPNTFQTYLNCYYKSESHKMAKKILSDVEGYIAENPVYTNIYIDGLNFSLYFDYSVLDGKVIADNHPEYQSELLKNLKQLSEYIPNDSSEITQGNNSYINVSIEVLGMGDLNIENTFYCLIPINDEVTKICNALSSLESDTYETYNE